MATAPLIFDLQTPGDDLARKTVFVNLRLGLLGNSRKVSPAQVEVDADKGSIHVSKSLLNSCELEAIRRLDGEMRRYLYGICLPFEPGIHLLPIPLIESVDARLREFQAKRQELVEVLLAAYPKLCEEAAVRLRTLYNPLDYPALEEVRSAFASEGCQFGNAERINRGLGKATSGQVDSRVGRNGMNFRRHAERGDQGITVWRGCGSWRPRHATAHGPARSCAARERLRNHAKGRWTG